MNSDQGFYAAALVITVKRAFFVVVVVVFSFLEGFLPFRGKAKEAEE